jgi:hypothetical protein
MNVVRNGTVLFEDDAGLREEFEVGVRHQRFERAPAEGDGSLI